MRVARLLIYEGEESFLQEQLGRSMNDGVRTGSKGVTITCMTLPLEFLTVCERVGQEATEYRRSSSLPPSMDKGARDGLAPIALPPWKLYRRLDGSIGDAVPAIQWTGDNLRDVQALMAPQSPLGPSASIGGSIGIYARDHYGLQFVSTLGWIVKVPDGFDRYTQDDFAQTFEPVPAAEPTKGDLVREAAAAGLTPPVREYIDGVDITKEPEAAPVLWKCPACGAQGFTPKTGTRATGATFEGCGFCVNEDGTANL